MILTTLICASLGLSQTRNDLQNKIFSPDKRPLYQRFFQKPTGKNGLEFYFQAFDLAEKDGRILKLANNLDASPYDPTIDDQVAALDRVSRLLAEGAKRPVDLSPLMPKGKNAVGQSMDVMDSFPIGSRLRSIAKATVNSANVRFSTKQSAVATADLLRLLHVSHDLMPQSMIMSLVGIAVDAISFAGFNAHLDQLKKPDTDAVLAATANLASVVPYQKMLKNELAAESRVLDSTLKDFATSAAKNESIDDEDIKDLIRTYKNGTPAQKAAYPAAVRQALHKLYDQAIASLAGPEHTWKFTMKGPWSSNPFANKLVDTMDTTVPGAVLAIAKSRTQMRLLRLHAYIQRFRLTKGRLPNSLAELKLPAKEIYDPLANKSFVYQPEIYKYKLASVGIPQTGEIELRYRRAMK